MKKDNNYSDAVDKLNLETNLNDTEFESLFKMDRAAFAKLPKWKRNGAKKKVGLF